MTNEQRRHTRLDREEVIFIEVLAATNQLEQDNIILEWGKKEIV